MNGGKMMKVILTQTNDGRWSMLKPIGGRVVIEKKETQTQTESGIIIPDTAREGGEPEIGLVTAVGKGSRSMSGELIPLEIQVGDKVLYARFSAQEIQHKDKTYLVLGEQDVIAIVEDQRWQR